MYDYLIVGAGLFGTVFTCEALKHGKKCLVIDKRSHLGGNIYTECVDGINIHNYGPHIFHTSNERIWNYVNQYAVFNHYINSPVAIYRDKLFNLPFNMNTFNTLWGVKTPEEAKKKLAEQTVIPASGEPQNLEEQALMLVGSDIYHTLVKEYTEKQWGRPCTELPAFIIRRLPVRFTYNNNYFEDRFQGIPIGGYTQMVERMLSGSDLQLGTDYQELRGKKLAYKTVYTGMIDEYFDYILGELEYRSLRFETENVACENVQGNAVVNYTSQEIPFTRMIEHKHFEFGVQPVSIITKEYPAEWSRGKEPYYPINDIKNNLLYQEYIKLADKEKNVIFGGRLASYKYYDMDKVIEAALIAVEREL